MNQQPPIFNIGRFRFFLQATTPIQLPDFPGAALRGALVSTYRRMNCVNHQQEDCHSCLLRLKCGYSLIFSTPNNAKNTAFAKNDDLTRPFVLVICNGEQYLFEENSAFQVEVTLIGRSIEYLPYFIVALRELGRTGFGLKNQRGERGKYTIKQVRQILSGEEREIYDPKQGLLSTVVPEVVPVNHLEPAASAPGERCVKVAYLTPCRVKYQGSLCAEIDFHILIRNALRRISQLFFFDNNQQLNLDYKGLLEKAQAVKTVEKSFRWVDHNRYSTRQGRHLKMGGVVGSACYYGELADFRWILSLCQFFHVGKGVTFGFGKVKVDGE